MILLGTDRVVEIDGCKFTVRPEKYQDLFKAADQAAKMAAEIGVDDDRYTGLIMANMSLVNRITAWEGIGESEDKPAPCTHENKLQLFAMRRDLLGAIATALREQEETDSGN